MQVTLLDGWVDLARRQVHRSGSVVSLSGREVALLEVLSGNSGANVERGLLLRDVWGLQPTTQTRTLDTTVRRLRAKLEPNPKNPQMLLTVHGVGYRWAAPVVAKTPDPAGSRAAPMARIPMDEGPLVGRDGELAAFEALGLGERVVLVGPAGVGKSRLGRAVGHRWSVMQAKSAFWVSCDGVLHQDEAFRRIAAAVGLRIGSEDVLAALHRFFVRLGGCLLVLDGVDSVPELSFSKLDWPTVSVLATQRARRGPWPTQRVRPLNGVDSAALFVASAPHALLETADELAPLLGPLGGLPLAIHLAARRLRVLTLEQLSVRVHRGPEVLTDPLADEAFSQRTRAWWQSLEEWEQADLAMLSVFREPFDLDLAEAVLGHDAVNRLEPLVDSSWLQLSEDRFAWLDALWAEANGHLKADVAARLREALAGYLASQSERHIHPLFGPRSVEGVGWLAANKSLLTRLLLDQELSFYLRTALAFAYAVEGDTRSARGVWAVPEATVLSQREASVRAYHLDEEVAEPTDSAAFAATVLARAKGVGHPSSLQAEVESALLFFQNDGDNHGVVRASLTLSYVHAESGNWTRAAAARRVGLEASPNEYIGAELLLVPFPLPQAEQPSLEELESAVDFSEAAGDVLLLMKALVSGALTALERTDVDRAVQWASRLEARLVLVDPPRLRVSLLGNLGIIFREVAQFERAIRCFESAERELPRASSPEHACLLRLGWASTLLDRGSVVEARRVLAQGRGKGASARLETRLSIFEALADALEGLPGAAQGLRVLRDRFASEGRSSDTGRCALWLAAMEGDDENLAMAEACFSDTQESERHAVLALRQLRGQGTVDASAPPAASFSSQVRIVRRLAGAHGDGTGS